MLTMKIEVANETFFHVIYRCAIPRNDVVLRFDTFTEAAQQIRRLEQ